MNVANDTARLVDDLAARWTDSALEIFKGSGIANISVAMEIDTWRTLREVMRLAVRRQRSLPFPPTPLDVFMKQVLLSALLRVARKFAPEFDPFDLEYRLRPQIRRRQANGTDCRLYAQLIRRAMTNRPVPPLSRSGFLPSLSAVGG